MKPSNHIAGFLESRLLAEGGDARSKKVTIRIQPGGGIKKRDVVNLKHNRGGIHSCLEWGDGHWELNWKTRDKRIWMPSKDLP